MFRSLLLGAAAAMMMAASAGAETLNVKGDQVLLQVAMSSPGVIPADKYFVVTPHKDSFDSRYALIRPSG